MPLRYPPMRNSAKSTIAVRPPAVYRRSQSYEDRGEAREHREPPPARRVVARGARREHERQHEAQHGAAEEGGADEVEVLRGSRRRLRARQQLVGEGEQQQHERHVHPEDQPPAVLGAADADEQAAEGRAEGRGEPDHGAEDAEGPAAGRAGEELLDETQHLRHEQARRDALQDARGGEQLDGRRDGAEQARQQEHDEPDEEQAPARAEVAEPPGRDEHDAEGEHVARDDELDLGRPRAEGELDRRDADVDLREVEDGERGDRHRDGEGLPAGAVGVAVLPDRGGVGGLGVGGGVGLGRAVSHEP